MFVHLFLIYAIESNVPDLWSLVDLNTQVNVDG
jgi:hypothetical protein